MSVDFNKTRIYFRAKNPNPLFTEWLEYWLKEAEKKDSMKKFALAKALESINKFPLVLYSGRDCAILEGFGSSICTMIDRQLQIYQGANPGKILDEKTIDVKEKSIIFDVREKIEAKRKRTEKPAFEHDKLDDTLEAFLNNSKNNFDKDDDLLAAMDLSPPRPTYHDFMPQKIRFAKGSFEIVLLVDTQETAGKSKRSLDTTLKALETRKVNFEVLRLAVGDFLWICRSKSNTEHELVLPYIIERKRMDDLASSIKDGRYHEQKFRLNDCGLPNKIYLIENRGNNTHIGLPIANLLQATTNVQLNKLPNDYYNAIKDKTEIELMSFKEFAESSVKTRKFTVREMFTRQLVSLKSFSIEKATAITSVYPTPQSLVRAYSACFEEDEAANLLANIPCGKLKRPLGVKPFTGFII